MERVSFASNKYLFIFLSIVALLLYAFFAQAAYPTTQYNPGETLNPASGCTPGSTNCSVAVPFLTDQANGYVYNNNALHNNAFIFGDEDMTYGGTGEEIKMFFNRSQRTFRMGSVIGTEWNSVNNGGRSIAFGFGFGSQPAPVASGSNSTAFGLETVASGTNSTVFGVGSVASASISTAFGFNTTASGDSSTAFGSLSVASAAGATAFGDNTTASGIDATAFGGSTSASGSWATAFGSGTNADGEATTAFGEGTTADADFATAFGIGGTASGEAATAFGFSTTASGDRSTSFGSSTSARSYGETALGLQSTDYTPTSAVAFSALDRLFTIGNGDFSSSDAFTILKNGNTAIGINNFQSNADAAALKLKVQGSLFAGQGNLAYASGEEVKMFFNTATKAIRIGSVDATTWESSNVGTRSVAIGFANAGSNLRAPKASGGHSTAFGSNTVASGGFSTAFGHNTTASTTDSTAFGLGTTASGFSAPTAFGINTTASGTNAATAFGSGTLASGSYSTAFGFNTIASATYATAFGNTSTASGQASTAFGSGIASGTNSVAFGGGTASGSNAAAFGTNTFASGDYSIAVGINTTSSIGNGSAAFGHSSQAIGSQSMAAGFHALAIGTSSFAAGSFAEADGEGSVAFGSNTIAGGDYSVVFGTETSTAGLNAAAFGHITAASGDSAAAFGDSTIANGANSFATGNITTADGKNSFVSGLGTTAASFNEVAFGSYQTIYTPDDALDFDTDDRALIVGIGTDTLTRADAFTILKSGLIGIGYNNFEATGNTELLQVNGLIRSTGSLVTSDSRLKHNVNNLSYGLNAVNQLRPVSYNLNSDGSAQLGFIAQEIQPVLPELVANGNYLALNYIGFIPVLTKAIQELDVKISNVDAQAAALMGNQGFLNGIIAWFANSANGIQQLFTHEVHTDTLCVGTTCVTEAQLQQLLQHNNVSVPPPVPTPDPVPEPDPIPEVVPDPIPDTPPVPDPVPEPLPDPVI